MCFRSPHLSGYGNFYSSTRCLFAKQFQKPAFEQVWKRIFGIGRKFRTSFGSLHLSGYGNSYVSISVEVRDLVSEARI